MCMLRLPGSCKSSSFGMLAPFSSPSVELCLLVLFLRVWLLLGVSDVARPGMEVGYSVCLFVAFDANVGPNPQEVYLGVLFFEAS